jgi:hypothetical protein
MYTCPVRPNCTIPDSYIVNFDADPDIDGIGVSSLATSHVLGKLCLTKTKFIAAFYTAAFLSVIVLSATYLSCDPSTFNNFGFHKLDESVIDSFGDVAG